MDIIGYLVGLFHLYVIIRICMFFKLDTECFRVALYRADQMIDRKGGDTDKIEKIIKKRELWIVLNPFIWTVKQCIKDKELYELYEQYIEEKKIKVEREDKDFQNRFKNRK